MRETCSNCGSKRALVRIAEYRFDEIGLDSVILKGIEIIDCPKCGNVDPLIPSVESLTRLIAGAIIEKPSPLTGTEVRYLRKHGCWSSADFAAILGVDITTLSKWENNKRNIGPSADRLIRAVALSQGGMKKPLKRIVQHFSQIEPAPSPAIIAVDTKTMSVDYGGIPV